MSVPTGTRRRVDLSLVVAVVGLLISVYLTVEHFTSPALLACPEGATFNCAKVTSSTWSEILGIPVAVLGLGYFVVMTLLLTPAAWRRRNLDPVRIAGVVAGILMVLYLIWIELFAVDAICLWCSAVHLCTLALFGLVLWRVAHRDSEPSEPAEQDA